MTLPRALTHDEKKATDAAFKGLPLDSSWTEAAKTVYEGIIQALGKQSALEIGSQTDDLPGPQQEAELPTVENVTQSLTSPPLNPELLPAEFGSITLKSRREAIESGILKDVTPLAQNVGLDFCVGITNPLWDQYITSSPDFTEDLIQTRLRDTLVAVRLRLASLNQATPLVDVPVLLQFPPEAVPQLCLTFALFHEDPVDGKCLLLIHPGEVFATRQGFENN